jgi:hypothetical protein
MTPTLLILAHLSLHVAGSYDWYWAEKSRHQPVELQTSAGVVPIPYLPHDSNPLCNGGSAECFLGSQLNVSIPYLTDPIGHRIGGKWGKAVRIAGWAGGVCSAGLHIRAGLQGRRQYEIDRRPRP